MNDNDRLMNLLSQITESTKSIHELTARLDEKIKTVIDRQNLTEVRHELMQAKIDKFETINWKTIVDVVFKLSLVIIACYLIYKY